MYFLKLNLTLDIVLQIVFVKIDNIKFFFTFTALMIFSMTLLKKRMSEIIINCKLVLTETNTSINKQ